MPIKAQFSAGQTEIKVQSLHQWDYGQQLEIEAVDLPESLIEVHFACSGMSEAIIRSCAITGGTGIVSIPDRCLEQTNPIKAWIYEVEKTDGVVTKCTTTKTIIIPIIERIRPGRSEDVPPSSVDAITELIAQINTAIDKINSGEIIADHARTANTAGHATTAGTANHANSADTASTAVTATKAGSATRATTAESADHATSADTATRATTADSAETASTAATATRAGSANSATNALKVNNLEIKRDSNGILKIGDIVIPQRKLVVSNSITVGTTSTTVYTGTDSLVGKTFEIIDTVGVVYKFVVDPTNRIAAHFSWAGGFRDANFDVQIYLSVDYETPNILTAHVDGELESFVIEKIYEIIE